MWLSTTCKITGTLLFITCSISAMIYALVVTKSVEMRAILAIPALETLLVAICFIVIVYEHIKFRHFTNNDVYNWTPEINEASNLMTTTRAAMHNLLTKPVSNITDGDCPICLEKLCGDDRVAIWYDGSSLAINVVNKPLAKCRCCMNVMHTTCLCDVFMNTALNKAEEGHLHIGKESFACPLCRTSWI